MKRFSVIVVLLAMMFSATGIAQRPTEAASLGSKALKGVLIGVAVKQEAKPLNKFINTITLNNHVSTHMATKVVPVLSVGEKGYIGGAQVVGPASAVDKVKAVWQYEGNFTGNRFRLKVLVPSDSLSPLHISRVSKVGISALIDVSLSGGYESGTRSKNLKAGDVLLAAGVAVAIKNEGAQLNKGINVISFNKGLSTKVVPMASVGDKAYIGGGQVTGSARTIDEVHAVFEYEGYFAGGRFRVKALVPTGSVNPLKLKRVEGVGVTAIVDMSLARQQKKTDDQVWYRKTQDRLRGGILGGRDRGNQQGNGENRHDNAKHEGWWKGKHKGWDKNDKSEKDDKKTEDKYGLHRRLGGLLGGDKN
jgi:hypothetical protein